MTEMIRVAPVAGGRVRRPDGQVLAAAGERVARDHYWDRRLLHGDVTLLPDEAKAGGAAGETKGDSK